MMATTPTPPGTMGRGTLTSSGVVAMPETWEGRPGTESGAAAKSNPPVLSLPAELAHEFDAGVSPSRAVVGALLALDDLAERLTLAVLADAFREALPAYWCRRARELEATGTPWSAAAALECRRHGWLIDRFGLPDELLGELRAGVAA